MSGDTMDLITKALSDVLQGAVTEALVKARDMDDRHALVGPDAKPLKLPPDPAVDPGLPA